MEIETLQTLELLILFSFFFFGIKLAQMKLDELVEDIMNLDINKESMDDNRDHSQDRSTVYSNSFNIDTYLASSKDIIFLLNYVILFLLNFVILNLG